MRTHVDSEKVTQSLSLTYHNQEPGETLVFFYPTRLVSTH
jgi:hypothetical protein